ncbi:hypothetical protein JCM10914A_18780 [Paenibacillus sp. JCM 10914]|uniref:TetR/AcrR family transcriptional regulator n=1 Tax=Paenibacillus sp. JCM 10914 TaxID=1236974 RepID=UPI000689AC30|nr:TetR/AcrR family transcriptional regulator [Paenibacillus sp. JCM 10914]
MSIMLPMHHYQISVSLLSNGTWLTTPVVYVLYSPYNKNTEVIDLTRAFNSADPRVVRTRQLILDAFIFLLNKRDFKDITVSDIAKKATVNRATFYKHFTDKYALLETLLSDTFMEYIHNRIQGDYVFSDKTLKCVVLALCDYHANSSSQIARHYESAAPVVEAKIKLMLEQILSKLLCQDHPVQDPTNHLVITMISWAFYGITYRWNSQGRRESPVELADRAIPIIFSEGAQMMNQTLNRELS